MRLAVVGAGALGLAMGGFLTRAGYDVDLVDIPSTVDVLNEKGVRIEGAHSLEIPVKAVATENMRGVYDVILLLTKQVHNGQVLRALLPVMNEKSVLCSMQNGVPEDDVVAAIGKERVFGSSVGFGATRMGPNHTFLTSTAEAMRQFALYLGELDGCMSDRLLRTAEILRAIGYCKAVPNIMAVKWSKLMANCTMSGMSAALNCRYADVLESDGASAVAARIASEVVTLAQARGVGVTTLQNQDYNFFRMTDPATETPSRMEALRRVWHKHRGLKASMLQDLEAGRPTEVDYINGFACRKGKELGIPTPANQAVADCIKEAEKTGILPDFAANLARLQAAIA